MTARTVAQMDRVEREAWLGHVREAAREVREADELLWIKVEYARRRGVTLAQLAAALDCSVETVRRKVREIAGRAA